MKTTITRGALALLLSLGLSVGLIGSSAAQEVPTGAGRIIEKVQTRIFISKASLTTHVGRIQENNPLPSAPAAP